MADMITADALRALKAEHPEAGVICYVNSSAEVKAESDICCTSAGALKVASSLPHGNSTQAHISYELRQLLDSHRHILAPHIDWIYTWMRCGNGHGISSVPFFLD